MSELTEFFTGLQRLPKPIMVGTVLPDAKFKVEFGGKMAINFRSSFRGWTRVEIPAWYAEGVTETLLSGLSMFKATGLDLSLETMSLRSADGRTCIPLVVEGNCA